jgi:hypothetical protein
MFAIVAIAVVRSAYADPARCRGPTASTGTLVDDTSS